MGKNRVPVPARRPEMDAGAVRDRLRAAASVAGLGVALARTSGRRWLRTRRGRLHRAVPGHAAADAAVRRLLRPGAGRARSSMPGSRSRSASRCMPAPFSARSGAARSRPCRAARPRPPRRSASATSRRMKDVVLPQAIRISLPATIGFLVQLIKGTSLAAIVGFTELARAGNIVSNQIFKPLLVFGIVGALYFAHLLAAVALWRAAGAAVRRRRAMTPEQSDNRGRRTHDQKDNPSSIAATCWRSAPPRSPAPFVLIARRLSRSRPTRSRSAARSSIGIQGDNPPWGFVNSARQAGRPRCRHRRAVRQGARRAASSSCRWKSPTASRR